MVMAAKAFAGDLTTPKAPARPEMNPEAPF
jgi:hypothetical protein